MNKYQEALNRLIEDRCPRKTNCQSCGISSRCNCLMKDEVDALQELVDKATPMKGIMLADKGFDIEVSAHQCCPNCKQPIVNVWSSRGYKPKYCHYCGQKLDWGDE